MTMLRPGSFLEGGDALGEVFEELASAMEPRMVGGDQLLAAVCTLLNETRALEHGDVLLHGGEAHLVTRSKSGHGRRFRERPRQDVASRAIGQGTEELVDLHPEVGARAAALLPYDAGP
jgi:hypothetical protein